MTGRAPKFQGRGNGQHVQKMVVAVCGEQLWSMIESLLLLFLLELDHGGWLEPKELKLEVLVGCDVCCGLVALRSSPSIGSIGVAPLGADIRQGPVPNSVRDGY